jgi:hypothetical protein
LGPGRIISHRPVGDENGAAASPFQLAGCRIPCQQKRSARRVWMMRRSGGKRGFSNPIRAFISGAVFSPVPVTARTSTVHTLMIDRPAPFQEGVRLSVKRGVPDHPIHQGDTAGPEISRRSCPQLAGSKFVKLTDHPALKSVSGPIGQAGCDDGLDDLIPTFRVLDSSCPCLSRAFAS